MSIGVLADPIYEGIWFGEGEIKVYLDGDEEYPTLCGTGIEDYIGSAWGQGLFANSTQGCIEADAENGRWCFYRWHTYDPIWFGQDIAVRIQKIGGTYWKNVLALQEKQVPLAIVSRDGEEGFQQIYDPQQPVVLHKNLNWQDGEWVNFYRVDDYTSVAYFYCTAQESDLPALPDRQQRVCGIE